MNTVTKTIGFSETASPIAIAALSTAENLTSTAQGIEELATKPTCESALGDVDLSLYLQSTSRFFKNRTPAPKPTRLLMTMPEAQAANAESEIPYSQPPSLAS